MKLYGVAEIASALGVGRGLVSQWHYRHHLPTPSAVLAMGPVWSARRIEPWIARIAALSPEERAREFRTPRRRSSVRPLPSGSADVTKL